MVDALSHVLVVEDDAVIRRAIGRAVEGLTQVRFAESVSSAMDALRTGPLPRFVLLDFVLPDGDGLLVLRSLRADARLDAVPVVMFSSLLDPSKARLAMQAGAQAWVSKPDDPRELRTAVRGLCARWDATPAAGTAAHGGDAPPDPGEA